GIGAAQVSHALAVGVNDHDVLDAVSFLLAAVVQGLLFRAFWSLAPPFGAVDDQVGRFALPPLVSGEPTGVAFGKKAQAIGGPHEDRQQPVNPAIGLGLAQAEETAQQLLQRISLLVDEDEQQLVLRAQQNGLPARPESALAWLPRMRLRGREGTGVGAFESG